MKKLIRMVTAFLVAVPLLTGLEANAKAAGNDDIVNYAMKYNGFPYRYGGTTPSGFDCSGFVGYVYNHFGIQLPRTAASQFSAGKPVSQSNLAPGDLLFFATTSSSPSHTGVYIGNRKFIHAASPQHGVEVSSMDNSYFKPRFLGARRFMDGAQVKDATTLLPKKPGQIGMITITKRINLWSRDTNNKLTVVRVLNPGERYRVYGEDSLFGGQYNLGSKLYVTKMNGYFDYIKVN